MTYPNFGASPNRSHPMYSWPKLSIVGLAVRGVLWLKSEINKGILRLTSESKQNTLRITSEVSKGSMNLRSRIQLEQ